MILNFVVATKTTDPAVRYYENSDVLIDIHGAQFRPWLSLTLIKAYMQRLR